MTNRFLIIGSGFSGAVLAYNLSKGLNCIIDVWEERSHIGGNCHSERDQQSGVMVHKYGPHIFNTDRKDIWDFVNSFSSFRPYVHRVKAMSHGKIFSLPINLHTLNQFYNRSFTPDEAREFLKTIGDDTIDEPQNFEEQALKFIGADLYRAFFYGYTKKQWGCEPAELPASILKRIPVRFNYDDNYHNNLFTGIPEDGYTSIIEKLLSTSSITVSLNKKFTPGTDISNYDHVFYTGPLDAYFNYKHGRLGYRTVEFQEIRREGDFQGTSQINYCDTDVPYTRITEHKHFTYWEKHDSTIAFREFSKETTPSDQPYYPKRLEADKIILKKYRDDAKTLEKVSFLGRLATYRYMDMHHVIGEAMDFSKIFIDSMSSGEKAPVFPNNE